MSQANPYAPTSSASVDDSGIRAVNVKPIQLMKRAYALVGDNYWLFLGITLVGILVGSAVPFGLILGPMLVGIYLCYLHRERGAPVEFGTLFKGFDYFKESFIAFLVLLAVSMAVIIPFMIVMFAMMAGSIAAAQGNAGNGPPQPPEFPIGILVLYPLMIAANFVITLPFLFTFQLIADRNMKGIEAVKTSVRGVLKNLGGTVWFLFVLMVITFALACLCYVPAILFMPISFGSLFLLYRDIFPHAAGHQGSIPQT